MRQGCNLSSLLVSLYISDLETYLATNIAGSITLSNLKAQLLLFADDLVLLADSESGLQNSMDRLDEFCKAWDLKINTEKTKVMIFNKPRTQHVPIFQIGNSTIDSDTHYKYLGIILSANGSFKPPITTLSNQTSKALFTLMRGATKLSFPKPALLCHLFDSLVRPVAEYGSEVWGHTHAEELEIILRRFCKFTLGVPGTTSNLACYGELGRSPWDIRRKVSIIQYWLRINKDWTISPLVKDACTLAVNNSFQWAKFIKQTLNSASLSYVWLNSENVHPKQIQGEFKERLTDQYIQCWQSELQETSGKLRSYNLIKEDIKRVSYLELPSYMRVPVARLRTSAHPLRIGTGRYNLPAAIPADERFCWFCQNGSVEDVFRFLFDCHLYTSIEEKSELIRYCLFSTLPSHT